MRNTRRTGQEGSVYRPAPPRPHPSYGPYDCPPQAAAPAPTWACPAVAPAPAPRGPLGQAMTAQDVLDVIQEELAERGPVARFICTSIANRVIERAKALGEA